MNAIEWGLESYTDKIEVTGVTKRTERLPMKISNGGRLLSQVVSFRYLGSLVSEDGRCDKEIKARTGMAKSGFRKMRKLLTNLSLNRQLR